MPQRLAVKIGPVSCERIKTSWVAAIELLNPPCLFILDQRDRIWHHQTLRAHKVYRHMDQKTVLAGVESQWKSLIPLSVP